MSEEITHPDGRIEHPRVKYEKTDASFGAIFGILIGAMIFAAFVQYVILLFFHDVRKDEVQAKESPYPLAASPKPANSNNHNYGTSPYKRPKDPVLEEVDRRAGVDKNNVYKRQENREKLLDRYGPTLEKGFVHIPLERAIALMETERYRLKARKVPAQEEEKRATRSSGVLGRPGRLRRVQFRASVSAGEAAVTRIFGQCRRLAPRGGLNVVASLREASECSRLAPRGGLRSFCSRLAPRGGLPKIALRSEATTLRPPRGARRLHKDRLGFTIVALLALLGTAQPVPAQPAILSNLGIDQRLDEQVPLDLTFRDETGRRVRLGSISPASPSSWSWLTIAAPCSALRCSMAWSAPCWTSNLNSARTFRLSRSASIRASSRR